ncbi:hypothetical protein MMC13_003356 [Lambiella insularis]|nr:hypothetical protein [Lambiella insularis]
MSCSEAQVGRDARALLDDGMSHSRPRNNLWRPSTRIAFADSLHTTTWNPADKVVFSTHFSSLSSVNSREHESTPGRNTRTLQTGIALSRPASLSLTRCPHLLLLPRVQRKAASSGALFSDSSRPDSTFNDHGLGRAFGDDDLRKPVDQKPKARTPRPNTGSIIAKIPHRVSHRSRPVVPANLGTGVIATTESSQEGKAGAQVTRMIENAIVTTTNSRHAAIETGTSDGVGVSIGSLAPGSDIIQQSRPRRKSSNGKTRSPVPHRERKATDRAKLVPAEPSSKRIADGNSKILSSETYSLLVQQAAAKSPNIRESFFMTHIVGFSRAVSAPSRLQKAQHTQTVPTIPAASNSTVPTRAYSQIVSRPQCTAYSATHVPLDQQGSEETKSVAAITARLNSGIANSLVGQAEAVRHQDSEVSHNCSQSLLDFRINQDHDIPSQSARDSLRTSSEANDTDNRLIRSPSHSLLSYQIPEAVLKKAMLSSKGANSAYWQYSLYENLAGERVKVHYCKSKEATERVAKLFLDKEVIGFDIEWKPHAQATDGIKKNISLIQLAIEDRIGLFHIARFSKGDALNDLLAPTLKVIMEASNISKVGVSIKSDCTRLRKFMGIEARGLFELSHLYKLVKYSTGNVKKIDKRLVSLAQQVEEHLQLPLNKGEVRSSDWSADLDFTQISYAASDSYAGLQLYDVMEGKRKALDPAPPRPEHAELNRPIRLANGQTVASSDEPEDLQDDAMDGVVTLPGIEQMARDFMHLSIEDEAEKEIFAKETGATCDPTKAPEVVAAESWVSEWKSALPGAYKPKASPAYLRAYALWHHQKLEVPEAARLLREPPLLTSTVSGYILEAIKVEELPYHEDRLSDVLEYLSRGVDRARYHALRK